VIRVISAGDNSLLAQRNIDIFDDFGASHLYFSRMKSYFQTADNYSDWIAHRVFLWAVASKSKQNALHRLNEVGNDARMLAETDYTVVLQQLHAATTVNVADPQ
jgi:hypothetical protein